jgi:hypothetical protein
VTFPDGRPVGSGIVEFTPSAGGPSARGRIADDGTFQLETEGRSGAIAGRHGIVVVQMTIAEAVPQHLAKHHEHSAVHPKYASLRTSGLTREVVPGVQNEFHIEVEPATAKKGF